MLTEGTVMLTREQLLNANFSEYMCNTQLGFFKNLLNEMRAEICEDIRQCRSVLADNDLEPDPIDSATQEEIKQITMLRVQRNTHMLHSIEKALERIFTKEYGYCEETGDPIGIRRLLANPTATLCIDSSQNAEFHQRVEGSNDDLDSNAA